MPASFASTMAWIERNRQALLFGALIATIALGPFTAMFDSGGALLEGWLGLTLLATTFMPRREGRVRQHLVVLVAIALLLRLAPIRELFGYAAPLTLALWSAIALLGAVRALRYAMSSTQVDTEHLLAALNAYLLVGVFLGVVWFALEQALPGSLLYGGAVMVHLSLPDAIYFSFVTLATLGYGDIAPAMPVARGLAVFEAVFGQLYLAVMVARLVSLRIAGDLRE